MVTGKHVIDLTSEKQSIGGALVTKRGDTIAVEEYKSSIHSYAHI